MFLIYFIDLYGMLTSYPRDWGNKTMPTVSDWYPYCIF